MPGSGGKAKPMKTFGNLLFASLLASVCLAPVVNADIARVVSGRPLVVAVRDFATTTVVSSENASVITAPLPRLIVGLLRQLSAHR